MRKGLWLTLGFSGLLFGACGGDEAVGDDDATQAVDSCDVCSSSGQCRRPNVCVALQGVQAAGVCADPGATSCCTADNSVCRTNLSGVKIEDSGSGGGSGGTTGKGGSGGSILSGGTGGTGGGSAGKGGSGSSNTTALGAPCSSDADCDDDRMVCLQSDGLADGSGPPGGLCTLECTSDGQCLEITDNTFCYPFSETEAYCIESCVAGTDGDPKCQSRTDFACTVAFLEVPADPDECQSSGDCLSGQLCSTEGECGDMVTGCLPTCGGDFDCESGVCDFRSGLCTDDKPAGLLPIGAACEVPGEGDPEPCDGFCVPLEEGSSDGSCNALCLRTRTGVGCGFDGTEPPDAACLYATIISPVGADGQPDVGFGDLMLCGQLCDCNAECPLDEEYCVDESADGLILLGFGRNGYCRPLIDETEADTFRECPAGSTGGTGGMGGSGAGETGGGGEDTLPAAGQGGQGGQGGA